MVNHGSDMTVGLLFNHVIKNSPLYVRKYRTCSTFHGFENVIVNSPPVKTKDNELKRVLDGYTRPLLYRDKSHDLVQYCHIKNCNLKTVMDFRTIKDVLVMTKFFPDKVVISTKC